MWFILAAASAFCFGLRGILYQWTSQRPINRNLLLLGVYASCALIALAISAANGEPWTRAVWIGAGMGLFSFISNAAMYKGYAVGKTSLVAMFTGLPPVVVVILAYFLWGETLHGWQLLAFIIIISGLLMIRYSNDLSLSNLQGAHWGVITMLFFGLTDVLTKQATLEGAATMPTLAMMYLTGSLLFLAVWLRDVRKERAAALVQRAVSETAAARENGSFTAAVEPAAPSLESVRPQPAVPWTRRRTFFWGMAVGLTNISGMMLCMPAYKLGATGLVAVIVATNLVFVLLYARFVLKEKFSRLEAGGLLLGFIGIVVLRLAA